MHTKHKRMFSAGMMTKNWERSKCPSKVEWIGTSLAVQWLRLCASNARGTGSIPGWGTKIPHAAWHGQKIKI